MQTFGPVTLHRPLKKEKTHRNLSPTQETKPESKNRRGEALRMAVSVLSHSPVLSLTVSYWMAGFDEVKGEETVPQKPLWQERTKGEVKEPYPE